jgi:hypothetical protein
MILRFVIAVIFGGGLDFAYSKLVGCASGACPLTSNPWIATIYGAVLGVLIATSFK